MDQPYPPRSPIERPALRTRNLRTRARMRRDVTWQILAPLAVAVVIVLVLMVLLILPVGAPVRSVWADVSLIFLIIPTAFAGLVALAVVGGLAFGVRYLLREVPFFFKQAQDWAALAAYRINGGATKTASLVMKVRSAWAGARRAARETRALVTGRRISDGR